MKKITVSILTTLLMLSMVFSSSVFAANEEVSAWDSFLGLFSAKTATTTDVGVEYRGHIQNIGNYPLDGSWIQGPTRLGTVGQSLRLEGFWIQLTNKPADVNIKYQVHVQNVGWMDPVQNGAFAGTEGKSQQIEAIKISLVDNSGNPATGYSVEYRGHVQNIGDTAWYKDGAQLGTDGQFLRLEALEVKIVKTTPQSDLTAYNEAVAAANALTEADYTADSWAALQTALEDNVVTADNTQEEVDAATAAINDAIDALELVIIDVTSVEGTDGTGAIVSLDGATNVIGSKDQGYTVTFSEAVNADTVTTAQIKMYKDATGSVLVPVNAPTLNAAKNVLTINPTTNLTDNTTYRLVLSGSVANADGTKTLGSDRVYTFTTGEAAFVKIGTTTKAGTAALSLTTTVNDTIGNVNTNGIDVVMSKALLSSSVTNQNVKLYNVTDSKYVANPVSLNADGVTMQYRSTVNTLEGNKEYRVEIGAGVLDFTGAPVAATQLSFTTYASVGISGVAYTTSDYTTNLVNATVWPKLTSGTLDQTSPVPQQAVKFYVKLTTNGAIDESSINATNIKLQKWDTTNNVALGTVDATLTYDATFKYVQVVPNANLEDGVAYRITLIKNGVKDIYGNKLAAENTCNFRTYDLTAPSVTGTQFKAGATNFVDATSGLTGVDNTTSNSFKVTFSEKVGILDYVNTAGVNAAANVATGDVVANNQTTFTATKAIMIWDYAAGKSISNGSVAVSYSADTKAVTLTIPANLLAKGQTYAIYLAGKNGLPTGTPTTLGSGSNVYPFVDITDTAKGNHNRMTDTYLFSFSTASSDTVAPKLSSVKYGTSIDTATTFPETLYNAKTAATSTKVYYTFDEKVSLKTGVPVTIYDVTGSAAWALKADTAVTAKADDAAVGATSLAVDRCQDFTVGNVYKSYNNYFVVTARSVATGVGTITISQPLTEALVAGAASNVITTVPGLSVDVSTTGKVLTVDLGAVKKAADNSSLVADNKYYVKANTNVTDLAGNALAADTAQSTFVIATTDTVTSIAATSPSGTLPQSNVAKDSEYLVTFGAAYDANTISSDTVFIQAADGTKVDATLTMPTATTVNIKPNSNLTAGATYTVKIAGVKNSVGNTFADFSKTAIISDSTAPTVSVTTPLDGAVNVAVNSAVTVTFDKDMDPATIVAANLGVSETNLAGKVSAVVTYDAATKTATITPDSFLAAATNYNIVMDQTKVKATNAVAIGTNTDKAFASFTTSPTAIAPVIKSATLYKGATDDHTLQIVLETPSKSSVTADATTFVWGNTTYAGVLTGTGAYNGEGTKVITITEVSDADALLISSGVSTVAVNPSADGSTNKLLIDNNSVMFSTTPVTITKVGW